MKDIEEALRTARTTLCRLADINILPIEHCRDANYCIAKLDVALRSMQERQAANIDFHDPNKSG